MKEINSSRSKGLIFLTKLSCCRGLHFDKYVALCITNEDEDDLGGADLSVYGYFNFQSGPSSEDNLLCAYRYSATERSDQTITKNNNITTGPQTYFANKNVQHFEMQR